MLDGGAFTPAKNFTGELIPRASLAPTLSR